MTKIVLGCDLYLDTEVCVRVRHNPVVAGLGYVQVKKHEREHSPKPFAECDVVGPLTNPVRLVVLRRRVPTPASPAQPNEVIHHPEVQAVWVCSPSQFHADQIKASARAGKHIFCEKPIATDLAGTIEAVQVR